MLDKKDITEAFLEGFCYGNCYGWQCCNDGNNKEAKKATKETAKAVIYEYIKEHKLSPADEKDIVDIITGTLDCAVDCIIGEQTAKSGLQMLGRKA